MKPLLLLTGGKGQLGQTFQQHWPGSPLSEIYDLQAIDVEDLDLTASNAVAGYLSDQQPRLIINGAAYTAVDGAEDNRDRAFAVNEQAVSNLASWCAGNACPMVLISTDFVFDGKSNIPYRPEDTTAPLSVYGASKLAGELQLQALLPENGLIVRTSWLYSEYGSNFVKTMINLMNERDTLSIVEDQIGSPTSTHSLVSFLHTLLTSQTSQSVYHWTDGAVMSWFDFAAGIQKLGMANGLLKKAIELSPISTAEYPTPARRPAFSAMNREASLALPGCEASEWDGELEKVIMALAASQNRESQNKD